PPLDDEPERDRDDEGEGQRHVERELHVQDRGPRDVRPEEHQLARSEIHHARRFEDQDEPQGHERIHAAHGDAGDHELQHEDQLVAHRAPPAMAFVAGAPGRAYSSSIMSLYFALIDTRRTFWVRVSSSSSASSSLSKRANAWM